MLGWASYNPARAGDDILLLLQAGNLCLHADKQRGIDRIFHHQTGHKPQCILPALQIKIRGDRALCPATPHDTFGPDQLDENLAFLREALGESVRDYLAKRFFDDHVTRYKKRPIYWLISSPKGAFQALIYMHRYRPDTLNTVLTRYVRPLRDRLSSLVRAAEGEMITASASAAQRNKAQKDIDRINKQITELTDWERDHLYPMALQRTPIDLDDGVKRNYPLFDGVVRPVKGISSDE